MSMLEAAIRTRFNAEEVLAIVQAAIRELADCQHRSSHLQKPGTIRACSRCVNGAFETLASVMRNAGLEVPKQSI